MGQKVFKVLRNKCKHGYPHISNLWCDVVWIIISLFMKCYHSSAGAGVQDFTYWQCRRRRSRDSCCRWPPETPCSCCLHTSWRTGPWSPLPLGTRRRGSTHWTSAGWRRKDLRLGTERTPPWGAPESSPVSSAVRDRRTFVWLLDVRSHFDSVNANVGNL